jgi:hypothetical protein|nr:MAG TPA_asm: hypothetical protein [Bacteriophage sp.]
MIKNIDLDYLDSCISNFDITDSINYNFENYINLNNFIDYLKKENLYDDIKDTLNMYLFMCHNEDKKEIENYSNELQEDVVNFMKCTIDECLIDDEENK